MCRPRVQRSHAPAPWRQSSRNSSPTLSDSLSPRSSRDSVTPPTPFPRPSVACPPRAPMSRANGGLLLLPSPSPAPTACQPTATLPLSSSVRQISPGRRPSPWVGLDELLEFCWPGGKTLRPFLEKESLSENLNASSRWRKGLYIF